jgi:hypothetical protein
MRLFLDKNETDRDRTAYISTIFYPACTLRGFFLAHVYFLHLIQFWHSEAVPVIWEGSITGGGGGWIIFTARIFSKLLSILRQDFTHINAVK